METTQAYFKKSVDELLTLVPQDTNTVEEELVGKLGKEVVYFDDYKEFKSEEKGLAQHILAKKLTITNTLEMYNGRIAIVLN